MAGYEIPNINLQFMNLVELGFETEYRDQNWGFGFLPQLSILIGLFKYRFLFRISEFCCCFRYTKTPTGKKRSKILEGDDEEKGKEKGKKK
jgi:hypothetical protein